MEADKHLVCPICKYSYKYKVGVAQTPTKLPCGDTFCYYCCDKLYKTNPKSFECPTCKKALSIFPDELLPDYDIIKSGKEKYVCEYTGCGKVFETRKELFEHLEEMKHQFTKPRTYSCKYAGCDLTFETYEALQEHIEKSGHSLHGEGFTCKYAGCGKNFGTRAELEEHVKAENHYIHKIICYHYGCGAEFATHEELQEHIRKEGHQAVPKYKCKYEGCGKGFYTHDDLTKHVKKANHFCSSSDEPRKTFTCRYEGCGQKFTSYQEFSRHINDMGHKVVREMK